MSIGENIKNFRKQKNMTQEQFAKKIEISRSYLSDIENNRKSISASTLENLSKKMNVSMLYLTTGEKSFSDLSDDEKNQLRIDFSKSIEKNNKNVDEKVKRILYKLYLSNLTTEEKYYLLNSLGYLIESNIDEVDYITNLFVQIRMAKDKKLNPEEINEVIDEIIDDFSKFLKIYLNENLNDYSTIFGE